MAKKQGLTNTEELANELAKLVEKDSVKSYTQQKTREILAPLCQSDSHICGDSQDALSSATVSMLTKISKKEIVFPDEMVNKQAVLMAQLKYYIKFYLLKRYARRSHSKPRHIYLKEVKETGSASRYMGSRFDKYQLDEEYHEVGYVHTDEESALDEERIESILQAKPLTESDLLIIKARSMGFTFVQIGEQMECSEDAVRVRFNRAMKKANLDKEAFNATVS